MPTTTARPTTPAASFDLRAFASSELPIDEYIAWLAGLASIECHTQAGTFEFVTLSTEKTVAPQRVLGLNRQQAIDWLSRSASGKTLAARPVDRPLALHEITSALFAAYRVDNGQMHVAGCRLEDKPLAVLSHWSPGSDVVTQYAIDPAGRSLPKMLCDRLGLFRSTSCGMHPARLTASEVATIEQSVQPAVAALPANEPRSVVLVLPRWASGAIEFEIGGQTTRVSFADWAAGLTPPPIICPATGRATYHLATTHDGQLAAAEEIGTCAVSQQRYLQRDLVTCATTGQRVHTELTKPCPVTGEPSLNSAFVVCPECEQSVSGATLSANRCGACRDRKSEPKSDPRLATMLSRYPKLAGYRSWKLAETRDVLMVEAVGWWQRLLMVVDRATGEVRHAAQATRWGANWQAISPTTL